MFGIFRKKTESFFSDAENEQIVEAIRKAEQRTSGELRLFVERRCRFVDPVMRAKELFLVLKMTETAERNGVLIYVAMKDRQLAVYGDDGIHQKVGIEFWNREVARMLREFNRENYTTGIVQVIHDIGEALTTHFPYDGLTDKNELPNDIVFG